MPSIVLVSALMAANGKARETTFSGLGDLGGGSAEVTALSSDGTTVVGRSFTASGEDHAFRWTKNRIHDLGTLGGTSSVPFAVSDDGSVVVGNSTQAGDAVNRAFRWTRRGMQDLGTLGGSSTYISGVSGDGGTVVGSSYTAGNGAIHAFRWKDGGIQDLGSLTASGSDALVISRKGGTIAGLLAFDDGNTHVFRHSGTKMTDLGSPGEGAMVRCVSDSGQVIVGDCADGVFAWSRGDFRYLRTLGGASASATATTPDADVVVGWSKTTGDAQTHAFRWKGGASLDLGTLGGTFSQACDVSDDGGVVVGEAQDAVGLGHPFFWTKATGMVDVQAALERDGVDLSDWDLTSAVKVAVSGDRIVVVGNAYHNGHPEPWIASIGRGGCGH